MIGALRQAYDSLRGSGDYSVTVPPMDGALNPNNRLEEADVVASAEAPDNLCLARNKVLFSSGSTILAVDRTHESSPAVPLASFDDRITCLAFHGEALAVGLAGGKIILSGGPHDGLALSSVGGRPIHCATALAFADPHTLLLCLGSSKHGTSDWKRDLMELGSSGSVWRIDLSSAGASLIGERLAFPFGVMDGGKSAVLVAESWRHRLLKFVPGASPPKVVLPDLPAYPARIAAAADGKGAWLALFAPRRQLTEFVLREHAYRKRMMDEVPPDYWVGPTLAPMKSFLEPLQGGTLKKLAAIKPWAPSRSYGLVVRLDEDYQPVFSFHSRADGTRHGITSALEVDGRLLAASHGSNAIVGIDLSGTGN